jgi:hypothetical protein
MDLHHADRPECSASPTSNHRAKASSQHSPCSPFFASLCCHSYLLLNLANAKMVQRHAIHQLPHVSNCNAWSISMSRYFTFQSRRQKETFRHRGSKDIQNLGPNLFCPFSEQPSSRLLQAGLPFAGGQVSTPPGGAPMTIFPLYCAQQCKLAARSSRHPTNMCPPPRPPANHFLCLKVFCILPILTGE